MNRHSILITTHFLLSALASDSGGLHLDRFAGLLLLSHLRQRSCGGLLLGLLCPLLFLGCPDGLLPLCLAHFGLHVPPRHDVVEAGAHDGPLELGRALSAPLGRLLLPALLVLAAIQHRPRHLAWVALHHVRCLTLGIQEVEGLPVCLDHPLPMAGINFVATERTQSDPGKKAHIFILTKYALTTNDDSVKYCNFIGF
uniref:Putative secreted protein n=1 Tax=Ixodes ricinus TaxID=34613 RepID=A0A6B0V117_IXORI